MQNAVFSFCKSYNGRYRKLYRDLVVESFRQEMKYRFSIDTDNWSVDEKESGDYVILKFYFNRDIYNVEYR